MNKKEIFRNVAIVGTVFATGFGVAKATERYSIVDKYSATPSPEAPKTLVLTKEQADQLDSLLVPTEKGGERLAVVPRVEPDAPKAEAPQVPAVAPKKEATQVPAAPKVEAPKVATGKMELPKPAAWDHIPTVSLVKTDNVPSFPKSAAEAAALFGVDGSTRDPKRWELTPDGGWHLSEAQINDDTKDALNVNARGYLMEGYYDTKPGRNPFALVIVGIDGNVPLQGGTFWNDKRVDQADKLIGEMAIPKWKDDNGNVSVHPVTKIVPAEAQKAESKPVESKPAAPVKYPETADEAAKMFNGKAEQWEKNSDGGWHFIPSKDGAEITVNPNGRIMEGYNAKGAFVAGGKNSVPTLGGTIWNGSGPAELAKLTEAVKKNHPGETVQVIE